MQRQFQSIFSPPTTKYLSIRVKFRVLVKTKETKQVNAADGRLPAAPAPRPSKPYLQIPVRRGSTLDKKGLEAGDQMRVTLRMLHTGEKSSIARSQACSLVVKERLVIER